MEKSSGSGSGSGPSPRGRGRPPCSSRGRGRGHNNGRSSLSSVVNLDSPSTPFPFNNAFFEFIPESPKSCPSNLLYPVAGECPAIYVHSYNPTWDTVGCRACKLEFSV
ncbi:hypothetical protein M9H77_16601 [Catharanthus roseus]|uniref:Uncharacterized protein n=1 Tax=Catharanthus roseus TaxID=4058 RepID=A0ACC0B280_CATRO|nr:hypothetical protein M9H77_16601 [Catharanthus roseus]